MDNIRGKLLFPILKRFRRLTLDRLKGLALSLLRATVIVTLTGLIALVGQSSPTYAFDLNCEFPNMQAFGIRPDISRIDGGAKTDVVTFVLPDNKLRDHELVVRERLTGSVASTGGLRIAVGTLTFRNRYNGLEARPFYVTNTGNDSSRDWIGFSMLKLMPVTFRIRTWQKSIPIKMWFLSAKDPVFEGSCEKRN